MKQICIALVLSLTGCSFFMTRGPSDTNKPPRTYPNCTTSNTYPIVDTVLTGLFVLSMAAAIGEDDKSSTSFDDDEASKAEKITSTAILAGVFGVSAFVGFSRTSKCRASHESFQAAYPNGMMPYGAVPYGQPYGYQQPPPAYPAAQQPYQPTPPQPYPGQQPQPYPGQQPAPAPAVPPAAAVPTAQPAASALGTEGDVCSADAECSTGLSCRSNVCMRLPAKK